MNRAILPAWLFLWTHRPTPSAKESPHGIRPGTHFFLNSDLAAMVPADLANEESAFPTALSAVF